LNSTPSNIVGLPSRLPIEGSSRIGNESTHSRRIEACGAEFRESARIAIDDPRHAGSSAVVRAVFRREVERRDRSTESLHQLDLEMPCCCQPIEQARLRKSIHLDEPVDRYPGGSEPVRTVLAARDGDHAAVEGRRQTAVQDHLRFAETATALGGREIQVVEAHGALQFVGVLACKEHDGRMRVDALHAFTPVRARG
jgi:hypothetical protein